MESSPEELSQAVEQAVNEAGGVTPGETWRVCSGCGEAISPSDPFIHRDPPEEYADTTGTRTREDLEQPGYGDKVHHPGHNEKCVWCRGGGRFEREFAAGVNDFFGSMPNPREILERRAEESRQRRALERVDVPKELGP